MITPGLVSITFRKLSTREIISLVQQAKLTGIEWGGDVHVVHGDLQKARTVRKETQNAGLMISAYGSYYRIGKSEDEGLRFETVLQTALELEAPTIRVWAGNRRSIDTDDATRRLIVDESLKIADLAEKHKISVSYEYHDSSLTDTNESALRLLKEANHPNIFTFWQKPHRQSFEYCFSGLKSVLPRLTNVHVFYWGSESENRLLLKEGKEQWLKYLSVIKSDKKEHFVSLEFVRDDDRNNFFQDSKTLINFCEKI